MSNNKPQKYGALPDEPIDAQAVAKLLAEKGILIDLEDPIFRVLLANKAILELYFTRSESAFVRQSGRLRKNATAAIMEAERVAVRSIQSASSNIVQTATKDVVDAVKSGVKAELGDSLSALRWVPTILIVILALNVLILLAVLFR